MLLSSWNVNSYRAVAKKGFFDWLRGASADVVCLQETKVRADQLTEADLHPDGFTGVWCSSEKRQGWSGTAVFHKIAPLAVTCDLPDPAYQGEGRLIHFEYEAFHLVNCYFPNGQSSPERLAYKLGFYEAFLTYAQELRRAKPVVFCGDVNTAHTEIDLKNPKTNRHVSGFLPEERAWIDRVVAAGYVDTFRMFEPGPGHYTWWDYLTRARERNAGWRIDYFFVSEELKSRVVRAWIEPQVMGSDHCPIGLELNV